MRPGLTLPSAAQPCSGRASRSPPPSPPGAVPPLTSFFTSAISSSVSGRPAATEAGPDPAASIAEAAAAGSRPRHRFRPRLPAPPGVRGGSAPRRMAAGHGQGARPQSPPRPHNMAAARRAASGGRGRGSPARCSRLRHPRDGSTRPRSALPVPCYARCDRAGVCLTLPVDPAP